MFSSILNQCGRSRALLAIVGSIALQSGSKTHNGEAGSDASNLTYSSSEQVILSPDFPFSQATGHSINNFMVVYDKRARNPKYVVERLYRENVMCADDEDALAKKKKRKPFFVETGIDSESFRVRLLSWLVCLRFIARVLRCASSSNGEADDVLYCTII